MKPIINRCCHHTTHLLVISIFQLLHAIFSFDTAQRNHKIGHCYLITYLFLFFYLTPERLPVCSTIPAATGTSDTIATATGSLPAPYDPVRVRNKENEGNSEDDYLWLSHCQSQLRWFPFRRRKFTHGLRCRTTVKGYCWPEANNKAKTYRDK